MIKVNSDKPRVNSRFFTKKENTNSIKKDDKTAKIKKAALLCSSAAALAIGAIALYKSKKAVSCENILDNSFCGKIPDKIIRSLQSGEKGSIINRATGKAVNVCASLQDGSEGYKILTLTENDNAIGRAVFKKITRESGNIIPSAESYAGKSGYIWIEHMGNHKKDEYSHVGTLLHRIMQKISEDSGCEGKVLLDSTHKAAAFHYDSGFRPMVSLHPSNEYYKVQSKLSELTIMQGECGGACIMYLSPEYAKKLATGKHCIEESLANKTPGEIYKIRRSLMDRLEDLSPFD